ncbi:MAG: Hpt domain-containing protein, partial [Pseudoalteromonas sp.]
QLSVQTEPEASELWDREATLARLLNKEVLLNKICNMFIVTAPEKFVDLKKFISDKNYEEVRLCAHSLKGLSGEVGAKSLRQHFAEIEVQAKGEQLNVDKQLELIEDQLPKLIAQMGQYL